MDVIKGSVQEAANSLQNLLNPQETQDPDRILMALALAFGWWIDALTEG